MFSRRVCLSQQRRFGAVPVLRFAWGRVGLGQGLGDTRAWGHGLGDTRAWGHAACAPRPVGVSSSVCTSHTLSKVEE